MTNKQKIALGKLKQQLLDKVPTEYEFKQYDVKDFSAFLSVYAELGPPNSEGTMAGVFCHHHFMVRIGPRGGTEIVKMS